MLGGGGAASFPTCTLHCEGHHWCFIIIYDTARPGSSGVMFCIIDASPTTELSPDISATHVLEWLLANESPALRDLYRSDLLIPCLTNEILSLLRSATTPSAVSALARSAIHRASRKRGRPSGGGIEAS